MLRAWTFGVGLLLVTDVVWLIFLQSEVFSGPLLLLMQVSPFIAAFVSSYFAPHKKVLLGMSMAIPTTILVTVLNYIYQLFGKAVDFPGLRGGLILLTITLAYSVVLCALGGGAGYFLTRMFGRKEKHRDHVSRNE